MKTKNTLKNIVLSLSLISASAGMLNASENSSWFGGKFFNAAGKLAANAVSKAKLAMSFPTEDQNFEEIRTDTNRLPNEFIKKFRLGNYQINESEGDIKIQRFSLLENQNAGEFLQKIQSYRANETEKQDEFKEYLKQFQQDSGYETIVFLQVGAGVRIYPDFFEKVFIVQNGELEFKESTAKNLGFKVDDEVQNVLKSKTEFEELIQKGKLKLFVCHKGLNSLTEIYYDRHDDEVQKFNMKRQSFKTCLKIGASAGSVVVCGLLKSIPVLGWAISPIVSIPQNCAFVYLTYQVYNALPNGVKEKIKNSTLPYAKNFSEMLLGKEKTKIVIGFKNTILSHVVNIFKK